MRKKNFFRSGQIGLAFTFVVIGSCSTDRMKISHFDNFMLMHQSNGPTLGLSPLSGISIIHSHGHAFKDLNRNNVLDKYEDWRLSPEERAADLSTKLSLDEIAGLMLYSSHQAVPTDSVGFWSSTYNGTSLSKSGLPISAISDKQKKFLEKDNLRAVLVVRVENPRIAAEWNNNLQAFVEGKGHGIPVNISSDPRNETKATAEYNAGSGGKISLWPCPLGLAATFDPTIVEQFGRIIAIEYRALGIATALSPQIDLATEPRWNRFYGTFGEDPTLTTDMARAYIDGLQSSEGESEISQGWGYQSVNAMVKHWPGGGPEEGGRDAHYSFGKYTVYPGNNLEQHLIPFTQGAFNLKGKTKKAAAIMPYYTVSHGIDPSGNNVGNGFSQYIISDLLRNTFNYEGVVCTDWGITHNYHSIEEAEGKCWGVESLNIDQRHYIALKAGVDQFGGNNDKEPILKAYQMWCDEFGEIDARKRFEKSAEKLLLNIFRTGLFENPYLDPKQTMETVGNPDFMKIGYEAQLKSIVMLKNKNRALPQTIRRKVYLPGVNLPHIALDSSLIKEFFTPVFEPENADFALVFIEEPHGGNGYDVNDREKGGNGYVPISLQYKPYTAKKGRSTSIAGGDLLEKSSNRSYQNKSVETSNEEDLKRVIQTRHEMGEKPVIVVISATKPFVPAEFEPYSDGILLTFGVQYQAVMEIVNGQAEPSALLPMQLPMSMETVELQKEDVPRDMIAYKDSEGNIYDFAFGLDWSGIIRDKRYHKYR
ncbi:MAG: glycoside hydrolase family 3 N-terminal domain-containing protein [Bacteroidales bacterium]